MKKMFKSVLSVLVLGILLTAGSIQAEAAYSCSSGEKQCVDAAFGSKNTKKVVTSDSIWFRKGDVVSYSWENETTGYLQVAFYIYDSTGSPVTPVKWASGRGGNNWGTYTIPSTGSYFLLGACGEGSNETRCHGGGKLGKF